MCIAYDEELYKCIFEKKIEQHKKSKKKILHGRQKSNVKWPGVVVLTFLFAWVCTCFIVIVTLLLLLLLFFLVKNYCILIRVNTCTKTAPNEKYKYEITKEKNMLQEKNMKILSTKRKSSMRKHEMKQWTIEIYSFVYHHHRQYCFCCVHTYNTR